MKETRPRVGLLVTHPIQYYSPWYRALSAVVDLEVFYSHKQTARGQAEAGFGVAFEWDVPVTDGFTHTFLRNVSRHPDVNRFSGCDTPEIATIIRDRHYDAFIVHGWATRSYWQAMRACWRTHTPLLVRGDSHLATPRTSWWRSLKTPIYRWFIPKFDAYLTVGTRAREYLLAYGADPSRCFRAPHAVDNAFFASQAAAHRGDRVSLRREFGAAGRAHCHLYAYYIHKYTIRQEAKLSFSRPALLCVPPRPLRLVVFLHVKYISKHQRTHNRSIALYNKLRSIDAQFSPRDFFVRYCARVRTVACS